MSWIYKDLIAQAITKCTDAGGEQPSRHLSDISERNGKIVVFLANEDCNLVDYEYDPETGVLNQVWCVEDDVRSEYNPATGEYEDYDNADDEEADGDEIIVDSSHLRNPKL